MICARVVFVGFLGYKIESHCKLQCIGSWFCKLKAYILDWVGINGFLESSQNIVYLEICVVKNDFLYNEIHEDI